MKSYIYIWTKQIELKLLYLMWNSILNFIFDFFLTQLSFTHNCTWRLTPRDTEIHSVESTTWRQPVLQYLWFNPKTPNNHTYCPNVLMNHSIGIPCYFMTTEPTYPKTKIFCLDQEGRRFYSLSKWETSISTLLHAVESHLECLLEEERRFASQLQWAQNSHTRSPSHDSWYQFQRQGRV